ncbi:MAG: TOBE domain-containing protein, partial [Promethearchaeota archaeon]
MKISARNKIFGKITALEDKGLIFVVRVKPSESAIITAVITREA